MSAARPSFAKRRPVIRVVLVLVSLLTAFHVFAQFLWIAPPSALRELLPGNVLTSWQVPWFAQTWRLFAPEPIHSDYHLRVRAILHGDDGPVTQWIDATDAEHEMQLHKLLPPRASTAAILQANNYYEAWNGLNPAQQEIVAANFWRGDDSKARFEAAVKAAAGADDQSQEATNLFLSRHAFTLAYATQAARAVWGDDVFEVQFEVSRQDIKPFAQRNDPDAPLPAQQSAPTGSRRPFVLRGQSPDRFAEVFKPLVEPQLEESEASKDVVPAAPSSEQSAPATTEPTPAKPESPEEQR